LTIRDIVVAIGFELDAASEKAATAAVKKLAKTSQDRLENMPVGFHVDTADVDTAIKSAEVIKTAAKPLEQNKVGFSVNKASQNAALTQVKNFRASAARLLGTIGLGFVGIGGLVNLGKRFLAENEVMQKAVESMRGAWRGFLAEMDEAHGLTQTLSNLTRRLANVMVNVFNRVLRTTRRLVDWLSAVAERFGGWHELLRLIAVVGGSLLFALKLPQILGFLKMIGKAFSLLKLKMLPIIAIIVLIGLLVDDFITFMRGGDSVIGKILARFGITADDVREKIRNLVEGAKNLISQAAQFVLNIIIRAWTWLVAFWQQHGERILGYVRTMWASVSRLLSAAWDFVKSLFDRLQIIISAVFGWITKFWERWGGEISAWFSQFIDRIVSMWKFFAHMITAIFNIFSALFAGDWVALWDGVKEFFTASWGFIKEFFAQVIDNILLILAMLFGTSVDGVKAWFGAIRDWFTRAADFIRNIVNRIVKFFEPFINIIGTITDFVGGGLSRAASAISGLLGRRNNEEIPQFASGTNRTPDTFIAGENGAELITGAKGRQVLSNKETANILAQLASGANFIKNAAAAISNFTAPATSAAMPIYHNTANTTINVNMEMNNEFKGDRAEQQANFKAVTQNDVMGELSRALAYAR